MHFIAFLLFDVLISNIPMASHTLFMMVQVGSLGDADADPWRSIFSTMDDGGSRLSNANQGTIINIRKKTNRRIRQQIVGLDESI